MQRDALRLKEVAAIGILDAFDAAVAMLRRVTTTVPTAGAEGGGGGSPRGNSEAAATQHSDLQCSPLEDAECDSVSLQVFDHLARKWEELPMGLLRSLMAAEHGTSVIAARRVQHVRAIYARSFELGREKDTG